jgi:hypothetical protein
VAIAKQQLGKHAPVGTDMHATIKEPLEAMFSVQSMPRLYSKDKRKKLVMCHESEASSQRLEWRLSV